ncbi:hypothetical protein HpMS29_07490 [Helicobacter pylori]
MLQNSHEAGVGGLEGEILIGRTNTSLLSSGTMAIASQALIPIPVVGALIGGFVGITMSKTFYDISLKTLKEAKEAHQRPIEIERMP